VWRRIGGACQKCAANAPPVHMHGFSASFLMHGWSQKMRVGCAATANKKKRNAPRNPKIADLAAH
jgi:hypothetical protein